jgi:hypothetical protein
VARRTGLPSLTRGPDTRLMRGVRDW